ncbi:MAG: ArsA family ATPase [Bacteroidetes bacterium]|nr:ArsA family ATPase [Bacteroidota bacterium]
MLHSLFQIGKGGVGKSTLSALMALAQARVGKRALLLSLDPAHNQSDIFERSFSDKASEAAPGLLVREPDVNQWIARYLEDVQQRMRESYTYLTALNLDHYFRVLRHAPGLEEFALRAIYQDALREHAECDVIVVDMPPTALALRFFASPTISGIWTNELLRLRNTIKEKREIITRIRVGKKEVEQDRALRRLEEERDANAALRDHFADGSTTHVTVVMNPDRLSWMESRRILEALTPLGVTAERLAINKWTDAADLSSLPPELASMPRILLPSSDVPLLGMRNLTEYLDQHPVDAHQP